MPIAKYQKSATIYAQYYVNKKRTNLSKIIKIMLIIILCVALVCVVVFFAAQKATKKSKFKDYAHLLVVGKFTRLSDAKDAAERVESAGGAGFVWIDEQYEVVAFAYSSVKEAESVQKNLEGSSWAAAIKKVKITKPKKNKLTSFQSRAVDFLWQSASDIFDIAIAFDSGTINILQIRRKLLKLNNDATFYYEKLGTTELMLKSNIEQLKNGIDSLIKSTYSADGLSSGIKKLCVKTLRACHDIAQGGI